MTNAQIVRGFNRWLAAYKRNPKGFASLKKLSGKDSYGDRGLAALKHYSK